MNLSPTLPLAGQVAVVTGAGRGIGHAIALRLAQDGARVAVVSRQESNARRTADEINAATPDGGARLRRRRQRPRRDRRPGQNDPGRLRTRSTFSSTTPASPATA